MGIFIDIFVLDGSPTEEKDIIQYSSLLENSEKVLYSFVPGLGLQHFLSYTFRSLFRHNKNCFINHFREHERLLKSFASSQMVLYSCIGTSVNFLKHRQAHRNLYRETLYLPFEDIMIPVPIEYDLILRISYGDDYMTPKHTPTAHGLYIILDPEKSYKHWLLYARWKAIKTYFSIRFKEIRRK